MTVEELLAKALHHAESSELWIESAGRAAANNELVVPAYLSLANTEAILAETYARMASAQVVNHASTNEMMARMAGAMPQGASS